MSFYKLCDLLFLKSLWVILFFFACFISFERGVKQTSVDFAKLSEYKRILQLEIEKELVIQSELQMQLNSESEPSWIELKLMEKLGLTPEDQTKIYFKS